MDLDRHDWLAQRVEPAIDPGRRIIDAHHHLWKRGGSTYLADELLADTCATHDITHTVFVECRSKYDREAAVALQPVGETRFVAGQADAMTGRGTTLGAIVGFADLTLGDGVDEVLDAHEAAGAGLFRGVRHATAWSAHDEIPTSHTEPTDGLLGTDEFRRGAARLSARGHSFDAWMYHPQLPELVGFARSLPDLTIVLNHFGAPLGIGPHAGRADGVDAEWRQSLSDLAACPNVMLKLGGIGMDQYFGTTWAQQPTPPSSEEVASHWSERVRWCIDTFGPERAMFESNYPVDRQTLPYAVLWNSFQIMAAGYDDAEQDQLFWETAAATYRLEDL